MFEKSSKHRLWEGGLVDQATKYGSGKYAISTAQHRIKMYKNLQRMGEILPSELEFMRCLEQDIMQASNK